MSEAAASYCVGLARREEVGGGGGDHHGEQDDPLAPPEHGEGRAQRELAGGGLRRERRAGDGAHDDLVFAVGTVCAHAGNGIRMANLR